MGSVLVDRQKELFVQAYTSNGMRPVPAALEAMIPADKAAYTAKKWLEEPVVKDRIAEIMRPLMAHHRITRERIIEEYARLAFYDVRRMYDENGRMLAITEMDMDTAAAICSINVRGIKMADKKSALDSLAKIFKVVDDGGNDTSVTVNIVRQSATQTEQEDDLL